ncbi:MAG: hypothetical protein MK486_21390 [Gemmatimonadetes bacterium]|nr:hypothetical protein [Gemmatimonadota bacterium]
MEIEGIELDPIATHDLELDKTGSGWVLTAWPTTVAPVVLRLAVHEYLSAQEPFQLVLEARFPDLTEFTHIGVVDMSAEELLTDSGSENRWSETPVGFRSAFLTMARTLGVVLRLTELGATPFARYPGEPSTSRDYLDFGAADDLPKHAERHEDQ